MAGYCNKRISRLGVCAAALLVAGGALGQAQELGTDRYRFTTVLDSERDGLAATRCPALNTLGTVAVTVRDEAQDLVKIVTKRGAGDAPVVVADTRALPDSPTFCDNGFSGLFSDPSINELGEVAFQGNLRRLSTREDCGTPEQRQRRQGVFLGRGGPLTTIAHTINPPGGGLIAEFLVADHSVNTRGQVALVPELDDGDQGLLVGSRNGTFQTRYLRSGGQFDGTSSRVSLNELGQVAFEDSLQGPFGFGIFVSNPDGTFRTIADNLSGEFDSLSDPSLNVFGRVAFLGSRFVGNTQVLGVFTGRGGPVTTVADSTGPYDSFREPSLNDLGEVVFTADLDEFVGGRQIQGVFTGPDPVAHRVLQTGQLYAGVPVTSVVTCAEALNDRGQIVMTVQSEDPETFAVRTFVVRATPRQRRD
jgi:hypothetical protein